MGKGSLKTERNRENAYQKEESGRKERKKKRRGQRLSAAFKEGKMVFAFEEGNEQTEGF